MSGINFLLKSAINYERTHQLMLYALFKETMLASFITRVQSKNKVELEPEKQLFDLVIEEEPECKTFFEIKMLPTPKKCIREDVVPVCVRKK